MIINKETKEEAAENRDLPLAAIFEVIEYCQTHQDLLKEEALEERRRLEAKGVSLELHEAYPNHPGILAVYKNDDPSKDMSFKTIVKAIANLEAAGLDLTNQFIALNHWNY